MIRTPAAQTSACLPVARCKNVREWGFFFVLKFNHAKKKKHTRWGKNPKKTNHYLAVLDAGRRQDTSRCLNLPLGHPYAELLAALVHFLCKSEKNTIFNVSTEDETLGRQKQTVQIKNGNEVDASMCSVSRVSLHQTLNTNGASKDHRSTVDVVELLVDSTLTNFRTLTSDLDHVRSLFLIQLGYLLARRYLSREIINRENIMF